MIEGPEKLRAAVLVWVLSASSVVVAAPVEPDFQSLLRFGAEMAKKGNWREARFRWEQALSIRPNEPHVLNNLAVAHEALGDAPGAHDLYGRALRLAGEEPDIVANLSSLKRFEERIRAAVPGEGVSRGPEPDARGTAREKKKSKILRLPVSLPVPARLDLAGVRTLLVASFLVPESELLDINREAVRFLRGEFRKHSSLEVLNVTPAPAVPEQLLDELAANFEFWRHLAKEHGADLIVSGSARFSRQDASGFQDVDTISPVTGQKVRQTRFVEQEQFTFEMDVLFLDGATGQLRYRDRLRRRAMFAGLSNDPITAFYDLVGGLAGDILATVSTARREESRVVFRK